MYNLKLGLLGMPVLGHRMRNDTGDSESYICAPTGDDLQPLLSAATQLTMTLQDNSHSQLALQCAVQVRHYDLVEGLWRTL